MDRREETIDIGPYHVVVSPDVVADFRDMPFKDESFYLVCFDPPHLKWAGQKSIMRAKYGQLDKVSWQDDISKGFAECMRVLRPNGTLVFKWAESQVPLKQVLDALNYRPLFGNQRGTTHWLVFMKDDLFLKESMNQSNIFDYLNSNEEAHYDT